MIPWVFWKSENDDEVENSGLANDAYTQKAYSVSRGVESCLDLPHPKL